MGAYKRYLIEQEELKEMMMDDIPKDVAQDYQDAQAPTHSDEAVCVECGGEVKTHWAFDSEYFMCPKCFVRVMP